MIRKFLTCLMYNEEVMNGYFDDDHHGISENAKEVEWKRLLQNMDRDFFIEYIEPFIEAADREMCEVTDSFRLYMLCKAIANNEEY